MRKTRLTQLLTENSLNYDCCVQPGLVLLLLFIIQSVYVQNMSVVIIQRACGFVYIFADPQKLRYTFVRPVTERLNSMDPKLLRRDFSFLGLPG